MEKIKNYDERLWYARNAIEYGWSRDIMVMQIQSGLYHRQELTEKTTNFSSTLPKPQSDLAYYMLKDPYKFNFLTIGEEAKELEVEKELVVTNCSNFSYSVRPIIAVGF